VLASSGDISNNRHVKKYKKQVTCLGFGVYLVNGNYFYVHLAIYTHLVGNIPMLFILRRSPPSFVPRRACCRKAQAIGVECRIAFTPTGGSSLAPQHASTGFFKWPPPSARR
jgi:hypothetical protein